ncbi:MAG: hypothetical protein C0423_14630 [Methylibium sp.]|nr:hypothetical protein [Methylibium sp.]
MIYRPRSAVAGLIAALAIADLIAALHLWQSWPGASRRGLASVAKTDAPKVRPNAAAPSAKAEN